MKYTREIIINAINKSILHWKLNAEDPENATTGPNNCSLCDLFFFDGRSKCNGCPVMQVSGQTSCRGTPYARFIETYSKEDALAEVTFLESLLNVEHFSAEC